ncbi:MAG TPA: NTP transferase domain-containing protein [Candidatus Sulfotelmatobacter sp.]|nr:NTP transferase domain-containing protein [Candidatus Sulfotelmatobacter sp.]
MRDCDCIIPAAGRSQRMGAWKPLLPFGGSSLIQTVVEAALDSCARVLLVVGYRGDELAALFGSVPRVELVDNRAWAAGMFGSIQRAAARVRTRRFFVTLGDMPWITPAVYRALRAGDETSTVVFPVFGGRRGHPVLFPEPALPVIAAADPASASMRLIAELFPVRLLPWPDDSILRDVDTADDLRRPPGASD